MSEIKLRSRAEIHDWLACLQAAASWAAGQTTADVVLAKAADWFYSELQRRIEVRSEEGGRVTIGPTLEFRAGAGDFDIEAEDDEEPKP